WNETGFIRGLASRLSQSSSSTPFSSGICSFPSHNPLQRQPARSADPRGGNQHLFFQTVWVWPDTAVLVLWYRKIFYTACFSVEAPLVSLQRSVGAALSLNSTLAPTPISSA